MLLLPIAVPADVSPELQKQLADAHYVYISSTRKNGTLSTPAEIWYLWHDGAVYVGTRPASWRVKRIKAGRPDAKIAIGSPDGPSFMATGSLVRDPKIDALILESFAKKYPERWQQHADNFRNGFKDGSRVVVKYVPKN
jgi:hypothetical protein